MLLSAIAQFERDLIAERTKAGIAQRKSEGVKFGAKQLIDVGKAAELFRKGYAPKDVKAHFKLRSISTVYRYFDATAVATLQEEGRNARRAKRKTR